MQVAILIFICFAIASSKQHEHKVMFTRTVENTPNGWVQQEKADTKAEVSFIVALKQKNLDVLEEKFWDVSNPESANYREFMSMTEITDLISPGRHVQKKVISWLRTFTNKIENRGDAVYAKVPVAVATEIFKTEFHTFKHTESGRALIRQIGEFSVPKMVYDEIEFVAGLTEFPTPRFTLKKTPTPETMVSISPQSIQVMYKTASAVITGNSSAGVIEFEGQSYSPKDLADFAKEFNVAIPALTSDHVVGPNQPDSPQIEATLDIQYILGVGLGAKGWFWLEDQGVWLYGFASHLFSTKSVPLVNSISYGWNEEQQCQNGIGGQECQKNGWNSKTYVQRINTEFMKLGLRGVTMLSASGDSGANGRTDGDCSESHLNPVFPGASPYITSVGATQISSMSGKANLPSPPPGCSGRSCASAGTEECVSFQQAHFASGGGFSAVAPRPSFQNAAVSAYLSSGVALPPRSYFNSAGKGFPDVSAFGSQVLILSNGQIEPVGGTSASAPIFGGIVSLLNDHVNTKTGKPLGFISPLLYKMAADHPAAFNDVLVGNNKCTENGCADTCKGFVAAKGWDPISGLGTPNFVEMKSYIDKLISKKL